METCLQAAFSRPRSSTARVSTMTKEAAWKMLGRPYQAILILAANEEEPPSQDEDDDENTGRRPGMQRSRGRTRRSGRQAGPSHLSWLHAPGDIVRESPLTPAYRLAALLVHKQLNKDDWDEAWNANEEVERATCLSEGVHPVWHAIAEKTPLLAQFLAFPKKKAEKVVNTATALNTDLLWIDPRDRASVQQVVDLAAAGVVVPTIKVAMNKVSHQLAGGRQVAIDATLNELEGALAFVPFLLHVHAALEVPDHVVKACKKADASLTEALEDFVKLTSGTVSAFTTLLDADLDQPLNLARLTLAWQHAPNEAESCSSQQLEHGLSLLKQANVHEGRDRLVWWRLKALLREQQADEALGVLSRMRLDGGSDVKELLPLLLEMQDERADAWLLGFVPDINDQALLHLLAEEGLALSLRLSAARRLCDEGGEAWSMAKGTALTLLTETLDLERLSSVFCADPMLALSHPYIALLVSHLAPANLTAELRPHLNDCRTYALQAVHGAEVPPFFTPLAEHLLLLIEGTYTETPEVAEVLNTSALRALSPITRALVDGGVVKENHLRNLASSLEELDLNAIEQRLFDAILLTLHLNRHLQAYSIGMAKPEDEAALNSMLADPKLPLKLIHSFSSLVLEYDLGLSNLASWYQHHDPLSPWAPLVRAALFSAEGDELNSAREYSRAAELFTQAARLDVSSNDDDDDSALALPLALYRKSLIHYAHATSWAEAVTLLDKVPALNTAITERFKLYLRVCHLASTDTTGAARLIRQHVQERQSYEEEDVEGNMVVKTRTVFNEEELDVLRNYPNEPAHRLPPEPFLGRVTAASTHISRDLRRSRTQFEHQFRQIMQGANPTMAEVYELAKEAAEDGAFEGLMYLERAQNSTKFSVAARSRLAGVEQTLFAQYKDQIPTAKRRFLHNLSLTPLVIIDTNILVDALVEKAYQRMNIVLDTNMSALGSNRFHQILLHHAQSDQLALMIPDDVRGELKQFAKDNRLMHRFGSSLINAEVLEQTLSEKVMLGLVDEVLAQYNTWTPTMDMLAERPATNDGLLAFFKRHREVFEELSEIKGMRGVTYRTELDGEAIYPESTDIELYGLAMHLASQPLPDIGAVLVATMDGDFTLVDRAIEEKFGFSVAKNNRTLKPWLKHQTN